MSSVWPWSAGDVSVAFLIPAVIRWTTLNSIRNTPANTLNIVYIGIAMIMPTRPPILAPRRTTIKISNGCAMTLFENTIGDIKKLSIS